jgi:hypothetical protein
MNKRNLVIFGVVVFGVVWAGIWIGRQITATLDTSEATINQTFDRDFKNLIIDLGAEVTINQADTDSLSISGRKTQVESLEIIETSQTLQILQGSQKQDFLGLSETTGNQLQITIGLRKLEKLEVTGDLKVNLNGFSGNLLQINSSTKRFVDGENLDYTNIQIVSNGSGFVELKGTAEEVYIESDTNNRISVQELSAKIHELQITSQTTVNLGQSQQIYGQIEETASVFYSGEPEISQNLTDNNGLKRR